MPRWGCRRPDTAKLLSVCGVVWVRAQCKVSKVGAVSFSGGAELSGAKFADCGELLVEKEKAPGRDGEDVARFG